MTEPTDEDLLETFQAACDHGDRCNQGHSYARAQALRAVLAKWGTPPAVAGEPVGWMWQHEENGRTGFVDCWQVENGWQENNPRLRLVSKLYTTPQPSQAQVGQLADEHIEDLLKRGNPTDEEKRLVRLGWDAARNAQSVQAQAGAVPLTDEQLYEERRTASLQLFDLAQQWADNEIHSYQFTSEAEKIVDAVARRVEAAHGIVGGQHEHE